MRPRVALTQQSLDYAYRAFVDNLGELTLAEALATPAGGCRSVLRTFKHAAAWSCFYCSFPLNHAPTGRAAPAWPRGLRDGVDTSRDYRDEIIGWFRLSHQR